MCITIDGHDVFVHFMVVTAQSILLDKPVVPFTQQLLRCHVVPWETTAAGTFV